VLRCTGCGGQRLPIDQDFCGRQCGAIEFTLPSEVVGNSAEEHSGLKERKKSRKKGTPSSKGKQREPAPQKASTGGASWGDDAPAASWGDGGPPE
ncbi:hypothetical protein FS837_006512, partial [Tulasnella sp. UAMH 9824]